MCVIDDLGYTTWCPRETSTETGVQEPYLNSLGRRRISSTNQCPSSHHVFPRSQAGSPLRSLQHIDSSANNNSNTKNGNCATVTVPPRAGQTTGADGHGQQHQADRIFASPTSVTASTRVGKEAEKKSTQLCHCSNRDNDRVSVLHQRVEELQAQCEAESAARISAEARAKRAESSLTEAQERISSLEVALRECAGLRFRAFSGEYSHLRHKGSSSLCTRFGVGKQLGRPHKAY